MTALFVVITFILFIAADILVLKFQKKKHPAFAANEAPSVFSKKNLVHNADIMLSTGHTWVKILQNNLVSVGIDDFITRALGPVKLIPVVNEGEKVRTGEIIFTSPVAGINISFRSPLSGTIKGITKTESDNKWNLTIAAENLQRDAEKLNKGDKLKDWLFNEFTRLKDFINFNSHSPEMVGVTMLDGGNIYEGAVSAMSDDAIRNFEKEFLTF